MADERDKLAMLRGDVGRVEPVEILKYHGVSFEPSVWGNGLPYGTWKVINKA